MQTWVSFLAPGAVVIGALLVYFVNKRTKSGNIRDTDGEKLWDQLTLEMTWLRAEGLRLDKEHGVEKSGLEVVIETLRGQTTLALQVADQANQATSACLEDSAALHAEIEELKKLLSTKPPAKRAAVRKPR